jgi:hypothetical protein
MNDAISLLLATTVLALGGLGLYMYKSSDDKKEGKFYDEDEIFQDDESDSSSSDEDFDLEYEPKPRRRSNVKTKRNKNGSGTKKKY